MTHCAKKELSIGAWAIIKVSGHQHPWLADGYNLEIGHFKRWLAWWLAGG